MHPLSQPEQTGGRVHTGRQGMSRPPQIKEHPCLPLSFRPGLRRLSARAARHLKRLAQGSLLLAAAGLPMAAQAKAPAAPWPVKVVIVTTFENGAETGDKPGELQFWAEREHLTQKITFPGGVHPILSNADHSVIAIMTGMSLVNAGVSVMALGTDPRFDLRKSYWLVAGSRASIPGRLGRFGGMGALCGQ
jgi:purine nucleoside permease